MFFADLQALICFLIKCFYLNVATYIVLTYICDLIGSKNIFTMIEMWNQRYAQEEYIYGKEPNEFFRAQLSLLPKGKILMPAEGEGRNAVYAATKSWEVVAFDSSKAAKEKAERLGKLKKVEIEYHISSFEEFKYETNTFDAIALIYAHTFNRKNTHQKMLSFLKPGGILILEGFSKKQIQFNSGGPRNIDMLFSADELKSDFSEFTQLDIDELETELQEGPLHIGEAAVIRAIGKK